MAVRKIVGKCDVEGDLGGKRAFGGAGDDGVDWVDWVDCVDCVDCVGWVVEATEERERMWPRARPDDGRGDGRWR